MLKLKIGGKRYQVAGNIDELTLGEYQELHKAYRKSTTPQLVDFICALSGVERDVFLNSDLSPEYADILLGHISGLIDGIKELPSTDAPTSLEVSGKVVAPKPWNLQTVAARVHFLQAVSIEGLTIEEYLSKMLALVVAPELYGEDWESSLELCEEEVKNCRASDAVPMAYFFLGRQKSLKRFGIRALSILIGRAMRKQMGRALRSLGLST